MTSVKTTRTSCKVSKVELNIRCKTALAVLIPEKCLSHWEALFVLHTWLQTEKSSLNLLFLVDPWNKNQDTKWCCGTRYRRPWWRWLSHQLAHRLLQTLGNCYNRFFFGNMSALNDHLCDGLQCSDQHSMQTSCPGYADIRTASMDGSTGTTRGYKFKN